MSVIWIALAGALAALCIFVGLGLWLMRRRLNPEERELVKRIVALPLRYKFRLALALIRDRRIPLAVRGIPPGLILYLATPIDLIPDFIPVLGHADDLLVVLIGIGLLLRFTPRAVLEQQVRRLEETASA